MDGAQVKRSAALAAAGKRAVMVPGKKQLFLPRWNEACARKDPPTLSSDILETGLSGSCELAEADMALLSKFSPKIVEILMVAGRGILCLPPVW